MQYKLYEVYCEKTKKPTYSNNNFSLLVLSSKKPTDKMLTAHLHGYHVCHVTSDICIDVCADDIIVLK